MDKRFTAIEPAICNNPEYGSEPCLKDVLEHYYSSHGIAYEKAKKITEQYVEEWVRHESYISS